MPMQMIHVRQVGVGMPETLVSMQMRMWFAGRVAGAVRMGVVRIVDVRVRVGLRFMDVLMLVPLREVQPASHSHQRARGDKLHRHRFAKGDHRDGSPEKGRRREVGSRARSAEMAERQHKEGKAQSVAEKSDDAGEGRGACRRQGAANG